MFVSSRVKVAGQNRNADYRKTQFIFSLKVTSSTCFPLPHTFALSAISDILNYSLYGLHLHLHGADKSYNLYSTCAVNRWTDWNKFNLFLFSLKHYTHFIALVVFLVNRLFSVFHVVLCWPVLSVRPSRHVFFLTNKKWGSTTN